MGADVFAGENIHGITIAALQPGDVIEVVGGREVVRRIVVRVVETTGARGGIVDTRPMTGGYSRTAGFVLGDHVVGVVSMRKAAAR